MTEIAQIHAGVHWEPGQGPPAMEEGFDSGSNSSKLFERSRIKALAGKLFFVCLFSYTAFIF